MPTAIFGQTIACECGRAHHIEPETMILADDALARLPALLAALARGRRVGVVMDTRTREVAGRSATASLRADGWRASEAVLADPPAGTPVCDRETLARLGQALPAVDLLLAVGAGVVSDLCKWLAHERSLPYACLATAASMNGYASANVAPTVNGIKTLVRARPPRAVLATPAVLRQAPPRLTAAGLGDILAKSVSSADWRMNQILFGDYYCARAVNLIAEIEPFYWEHPERVRAGGQQAVEALFTGLLLTGAAMTMAATSSPSSGGEHLLSHALDMHANVRGGEHDLHGRQVGVGTILASALYEAVLACERPAWKEPPGDVDRDFWRHLAPAVQEQYAAKRGRLRAARERLARGGTWDELRRAVAPMLRTPAAIKERLARAGGAHTATDIGCDPEYLSRIFLRAHTIRSRFTILDLAHLAGVLPDRARELVETWT